MVRVLETGEPLFFEDIQSDPEFQRLAQKRVMLRAGFRAQFLIPVRAKGKNIGMVNFLSKNPHRFSPSEAELIHSIVNHVAVALENAILFSEIKRANRELQEACEAKSNFLAAVSHELRTPLNVIVGNAGLIKDGFFGVITEKQNNALEKILRHSRILLKLINDVLKLTRIEAKEM